VLKAGADGLLFSWDGGSLSQLDSLKEELEAVRATHEDLVVGLKVTGALQKLDTKTLAALKELGLNYILVPLDAPARLLALDAKEMEKVIIVPERAGEMYPLFIRNLATLEGIAGVLLDFSFHEQIGSLSIETLLHYQAIREAVRFPALINVAGDLSEADAYTLKALGVQALVLNADKDEEETRSEIKSIRAILEKLSVEENEAKRK
jgi:biotin synthase-like enzyme